jgi:CBS domain-containing protein
MAHFDVPVSLYMQSPVRAIPPETSLSQAHARLAELNISSLAVTEGDTLVGIITRTDLLRIGQIDAGARPGAALLTFRDEPVSGYMTREVATVALEDTLTVAAARMVERSHHRVFVCDGVRLVGVLSVYDLMQALSDKRVSVPIAEIMSSPLFTVRAEEPISLAAERLGKARVSGLVVVDDDWPVGLFTQVEALASRDLPRNTAVEQVMESAVICLPTTMPLHRAAAQATRMRARRIVAVAQRDMRGILSGLDFARFVAG